MSYFKQLFNKKPEPTKPSAPVNRASKLKVALIRGHEGVAQGADAFNGTSEYNYWREVNAMVVSSKHELKEFTRDDGGITNACRHANAWGADIIIETHFNSYNKKAYGCEALYLNASQLAKDFCRFMEDNYDCKNRGAKNMSGGGAGKYNIQQAEKYVGEAILIEPFFGDNMNDYIEPKVMAEALTGFINTL